MEGYIIYALLAYVVYRDLVHDYRLNKLLNRLMAKNYEEFEYYEKKYDGDLKEVRALRDEARDEREETQVPVAEEDKETMEILEAMEEDWTPEDIDKTKIKKLLD